MLKYWFAVLTVLAIHCGNTSVMGQSTAGEIDDDGHCIANDLSQFLIDFRKYYSDMKNLREQMQREYIYSKAQMTRLENSIERHNTQVSNSVDEIKRQIRMENMEMKNGLQELHQKLPSRLCPRGFNYSVGRINKCYAVLTDRVTWSTAQRKCIELNRDAQLVVINSSREQRIIDEMLADIDCRQRNGGRYNILTNQFWIGARREDISNCSSPIEWTSNKGMTDPMEYSNWASNEPNCGFTDEACAAINKERQFKWNDLTCSWNACPLCEVTVQT